MKLNQEEKKAAEFLKEFATNLAEGKPTAYTQPILGHLEKMGIKISFVSHKEVIKLKRGKDDVFPWHITNAPWYIRGKVSATYLPFQVKEFKPKKRPTTC